MPRFQVIISVVILIAALVILFIKLFTPQPIQITLESGQQVTTSTSEYFTITEVILLIVSAFAIGMAATYLFYNSDRAKNGNSNKEVKETKGDMYSAILPLLKEDEKKIVNYLREAGGEMQQNKLVTKLGTSKVKVTRILYGLQHKNLIKKERHGLTNMVKLLR